MQHTHKNSFYTQCSIDDALTKWSLIIEALITGAVFVLIGWILWKAAKIAWALLLFGGAVIALLFWEGIKAYNAELAAIAAVAGALIGGWRYMKARL